MFAPVRKKRLQTDSTSSGEAITKPNEDSDNEGVWLKDEPKKMVSSEMDSSSDSDSSSSSTSSCSSSSHIDVLTNVENTAIESSDNRSGSIYNLDDVEEFDSGTESEIDTSQNDMVLSISIPRSIEGLTIPISKATPTPPPTNKESSGSPPHTVNSASSSDSTYSVSSTNSSNSSNDSTTSPSNSTYSTSSTYANDFTFSTSSSSTHAYNPIFSTTSPTHASNSTFSTSSPTHASDSTFSTTSCSHASDSTHHKPNVDAISTKCITCCYDNHCRSPTPLHISIIVTFISSSPVTITT